MIRSPAGPVQQIRLVSRDRSLPLVSAKNLRIGSYDVRTPTRSFSLSKSRRCAHRVSAGSHQITETYFRLNRSKLDAVDTAEWMPKTRRLLSKAAGALPLLVLEYRDPRNRVPGAVETDKLADMASSTPAPVVVPVLSGAGILDTVSFTESFAASLPRKPPGLIASIPAHKPGAVLEAGREMAKMGVSMFLLNFDGGDPTTMPLMTHDIMLLSKMVSKEFGADCFFYAFNVQKTRVHAHSYVGEGRDMLSLLTGIDCLGDMHTIPKQARRNGSRAPLTTGTGGDLRNVRLFNRADYGYYSVVDAIGLFEKKNGMSPSMIRQCPPAYAGEIAHAFNTEAQALEAESYHGLINEGTLREHLASKKHAGRILHRIISGCGDTRLYNP